MLFVAVAGIGAALRVVESSWQGIRLADPKH
jgi:hypothetical protein